MGALHSIFRPVAGVDRKTEVCAKEGGHDGMVGVCAQWETHVGKEGTFTQRQVRICASERVLSNERHQCGAWGPSKWGTCAAARRAVYHDSHVRDHEEGGGCRDVSVLGVARGGIAGGSLHDARGVRRATRQCIDESFIARLSNIDLQDMGLESGVAEYHGNCDSASDDTSVLGQELQEGGWGLEEWVEERHEAAVKRPEGFGVRPTGYLPPSDDRGDVHAIGEHAQQLRIQSVINE